MRRLTAVAICLAGCSFVGVRGPSERVAILPENATDLRCSQSAALPTLDAVAGGLAALTAVAGVIFEKGSDGEKFPNFTRYYAGPLAGAAIVYYISAGFGNRRVTWCLDAHQRLIEARDVVRPIDGVEPVKDDPDIEIGP